MKRCGACRVEKAHSDFTKNKSAKDGLDFYCRECTRVRNRASYARNKEKESARKAKAYQENKEAMLARNRRWREANREKERAQHKVYYANNPHIFAKRGTNRKESWAAIEKFEFSKRDYQSLLNRYSNSCAYCKHGFSDDLTVSLDHVVPVSRGGTHGAGNLVPSCRPCNSSKNSRTLMEWRVSGSCRIV